VYPPPRAPEADRDRSVDFYSRVLAFTVISDVEVAGVDVERLPGIFGLHMRAARTPLVSPGLGFRTGTMVRVPDGHALRVLAP